MLRGRSLGEVPALIERPRAKYRLAPASLWSKPPPDEESAEQNFCWRKLTGEGEVVVLPVHTREVRERLHAALRPMPDAIHILGR